MLKFKYYTVSYFIYIILTIFCISAPAVALIKNSFSLEYSSLKKYTFKNRKSIHKLNIKQGIVYKLNTAPGFVSVITLPVIPLDVALGNTGAFSEQVVGRQIFIKPVTYDVRATSNLEIYTKFGLINVLLRIKSPKSVTYNLDISGTVKDVFAKNYIKKRISVLKGKLIKEYALRDLLLTKKALRLKAEKKEIMGLILLINRTKINKSVTKSGITLTAISISRIKNLYYIGYQLTNNSDKDFLLRNIYLFGEYGGNFFDGYAPDREAVIPIINDTPHNVSYMPYKIIKNVLIFKKSKITGRSNNLKISFHILIGGKLIKLKINGISINGI